MTDQTYKGLNLDRFQREAIAAIARGDHCIVAAPTGAGKTLIAEYAIERALREGRRVVYTSPIKALSNQKYRDFSNIYPGRVGITTGDVSIRPDADALIMTTEIFRNTVFESPERLADVRTVIFDEVHYMDDLDRGTVWEESLIFAPPEIRFLALSATISNLDDFAKWIESIRPGHLEVVVETQRPVPLEISLFDSERGVTPVGEATRLRKKDRERQRRKIDSIPARFRKTHRKLVEEILSRGELPCLFFLFGRKGCERLAEDCTDLDFYSSDSDRREALRSFDELCELYQIGNDEGDVHLLRRLLAQGISYHHAGLLPVLKEIVERLFADGHIRLLFATETFALGINAPARAVAFEGLRKWNGRARVPLLTRQFMQMAGRAGRRGLDELGSVYVTFDPVLDHLDVAQSIISGAVEPVTSRFNLSYATVLNLWEHLGPRIFNACERSFANFCMELARQRETGRRKAYRHAKGKRQGRRGRMNRGRNEESKAPQEMLFSGMVQQVQCRIEVLAKLGMLRQDADDPSERLTDRGRFAAQVYGSELPATELVFRGMLDGLKAEKIAMVFCALVHESRPDASDGGFDPRQVLGRLSRKIDEMVAEVHRIEGGFGISEPCRGSDWLLSGAVWAWAQGEDFAEVRARTDVSDGDLVRSLRQTIQLLRNVSYPLKSSRDERHRLLARRMTSAINLLKRGLVDAEWQLQVEEEEPQAAEPQAAEPQQEAPMTTKISDDTPLPNFGRKRSR